MPLAAAGPFVRSRRGGTAKCLGVSVCLGRLFVFLCLSCLPLLFRGWGQSFTDPSNGEVVLCLRAVHVRSHPTGWGLLGWWSSSRRKMVSPFVGALAPPLAHRLICSSKGGRAHLSLVSVLSDVMCQCLFVFIFLLRHRSVRLSGCLC